MTWLLAAWYAHAALPERAVGLRPAEVWERVVAACWPAGGTDAALDCPRRRSELRALTHVPRGAPCPAGMVGWEEFVTPGAAWGEGVLGDVQVCVDRDLCPVDARRWLSQELGITGWVVACDLEEAPPPTCGGPCGPSVEIASVHTDLEGRIREVHRVGPRTNGDQHTCSYDPTTGGLVFEGSLRDLRREGLVWSHGAWGTRLECAHRGETVALSADWSPNGHAELIMDHTLDVPGNVARWDPFRGQSLQPLDCQPSAPGEWRCMDSAPGLAPGPSPGPESEP